MLILAEHGTRRRSGVQEVYRLAAAVADRLAVPEVPVCFVDVLGPSPAEVLRGARGRAVLLPAFLASGYHVRVDVPREVGASGHPDVVVTPALGPHRSIARVGMARLRHAGWQPGDAVVLAAAGSSDPVALAQVHRAAAMLAALTGAQVRVGYVATATPRVPAVVAELRRQGAARVVISPYLLAPGLFHTGLAEAGADAVAAPLGVHPELVDLVVRRYADATPAHMR